MDTNYSQQSEPENFIPVVSQNYSQRQNQPELSNDPIQDQQEDSKLLSQLPPAQYPQEENQNLKDLIGQKKKEIRNFDKSQVKKEVSKQMEKIKANSNVKAVSGKKNPFVVSFPLYQFDASSKIPKKREASQKPQNTKEKSKPAQGQKQNNENQSRPQTSKENKPGFPYNRESNENPETQERLRGKSALGKMLQKQMKQNKQILNLDMEAYMEKKQKEQKEAQQRFMQVKKETKAKEEQAKQQVLQTDRFLILQQQMGLQKERDVKKKQNIEKILPKKEENKIKAQDIKKAQTPQAARQRVEQKPLSEQEILNLKDVLRELQNELQNQKRIKQNITEDINMQEQKNQKLSQKVDDLIRDKAVVPCGNQLVRDGYCPKKVQDKLYKQENQYDELDLDFQETPLDRIIAKFEASKLTLEQIFKKLDNDQNGLLTLEEIEEGLQNFEVKIKPEEITLIKETLDKNSDGVVSCQEFINYLDPPLKIQKEYREIMAEVQNPIILEERILDMTLRGQMLKKQLNKMLKIETEDKYSKELVEIIKRKEQEKKNHFAKVAQNKKFQLEKIQELKKEIARINIIEQNELELFNKRESEIQRQIRQFEDELMQTTKELTKKRNEFYYKQTETLKFEVEIANLVQLESKFEEQIQQQIKIEQNQSKFRKEDIQKRKQEIQKNRTAATQLYMNTKAIILIQAVFKGIMQRKKYKIQRFMWIRAVSKIQRY